MSPKKASARWLSNLNRLSDVELLRLRICELRLRLPGSLVESKVIELYGELEARGIHFRPHIYFGDEWFSPEGMLAIAVPFYLAHPRLMMLEQRQMLEVEGGDPGYFMRLLRHEAGHCFDHAYGFSRRARWRERFGSPAQEYHPESYRPRPYSRSFVRNLDHWYAQAHPDEDFAETFATWLDPERDWRREYARWPVALEKLQYIDELAREKRGKAPRPMATGYLPCSAARLRTTLGKYYEKRRRENASDHPDSFDRDLMRIFPQVPLGGGAGAEKGSAAQFMRRHREELIEAVSHWTGERKYTVHSLVDKLARRCQDLGLSASSETVEGSIRLSAYLATLVTHYLFTGKFKRSV